MSYIELRRVVKKFGSKESLVTAIDHISLCIKKGELIAIVGPSGSGKTTLVNILGCLTSISSGEYYLDGESMKDLTPKELAIVRNQKFGFIVQNFALINNYSVYDNIVIPLEYAKKKNKKELVINITKKLQIEDKRNRFPDQLSGGQKQRVAIARALVNNPEIIFADEPTGSLDQKTGLSVMQLLIDINKSGKTVIIITHNMKVAGMCSRIINLVDGKVV